MLAFIFRVLRISVYAKEKSKGLFMQKINNNTQYNNNNNNHKEVIINIYM